jgi:hypothetical protein
MSALALLFKRIVNKYTQLPCVYANVHALVASGQLTSPWGVWFRELILRKLPVHVLEKKLRNGNLYDANPWLARFEELRAKHA